MENITSVPRNEHNMNSTFKSNPITQCEWTRLRSKLHTVGRYLLAIAVVTDRPKALLQCFNIHQLILILTSVQKLTRFRKHRPGSVPYKGPFFWCKTSTEERRRLAIKYVRQACVTWSCLSSSWTVIIHVKQKIYSFKADDCNNIQIMLQNTEQLKSLLNWNHISNGNCFSC